MAFPPESWHLQHDLRQGIIVREAFSIDDASCRVYESAGMRRYRNRAMYTASRDELLSFDTHVFDAQSEFLAVEKVFKHSIADKNGVKRLVWSFLKDPRLCHVVTFDASSTALSLIATQTGITLDQIRPDGESCLATLYSMYQVARGRQFASSKHWPLSVLSSDATWKATVQEHPQDPSLWVLDLNRLRPNSPEELIHQKMLDEEFGLIKAMLATSTTLCIVWDTMKAQFFDVSETGIFSERFVQLSNGSFKHRKIDFAKVDLNGDWFAFVEDQCGITVCRHPFRDMHAQFESMFGPEGEVCAISISNGLLFAWDCPAVPFSWINSQIVVRDIEHDGPPLRIINVGHPGNIDGIICMDQQRLMNLECQKPPDILKKIMQEIPDTTKAEIENASRGEEINEEAQQVSASESLFPPVVAGVVHTSEGPGSTSGEDKDEHPMHEEVQEAIRISSMEAAAKENADIAEAVVRSKSDLPAVSGDDVVLFRLSPCYEDTKEILLKSTSLQHCLARVADAGCTCVHKSGAIILVPLVEDLIEESGLELEAHNLIALRSDKEDVMRALRALPSRKRPQLKGDHNFGRGKNFTPGVLRPEEAVKLRCASSTTQHEAVVCEVNASMQRGGIGLYESENMELIEEHTFLTIQEPKMIDEASVVAHSAPCGHEETKQPPNPRKWKS